MMRPRICLTGTAILAAFAITGAMLTSRPAVAQGPNAGPVPVSIASPLPLPVSQVGNPLQTPFQIDLNSNAPGNFFTLDPNKRLTIEFVSSQCSYPDNAAAPPSTAQLLLFTTIGTKSVAHYFYPTFALVDAEFSRKLYGSAHQTRIYADPGTEVGVRTRPGQSQKFACDVTLSGYTVPK